MVTSKEFDRVAGLYRSLDLLDPKFRYLRYVIAFEVERRGDTLVSNSRITGQRTLLSIEPNRFRILGSMYEDFAVLFDSNAV